MGSARINARERRGIVRREQVASGNLNARMIGTYNHESPHLECRRTQYGLVFARLPLQYGFRAQTILMQAPHVPRRLPVIALLSLSMLGCGPEKDSEDEAPPAVPVATAKVEKGPIAALYKGTATVEAASEAVVVARLAGVVDAIHVEEGQLVAPGTALARLDDERLRLELARAEARHQQLMNEHERSISLLDKQLISREAFERTRFNLAAAKADLDLAQLNLHESVIRAPIAGVISAREVKTGNLVPVHAPLFRISDLSRLEAALHVPERDIHKLRPGQQAAMQVDAWPQEQFQGEVLRINPVVDAGSGTVKVTIALPNAENRLLPGMFGRVAVTFDRREDTLLIPKDAVQIEDAQAWVYVVDKDRALRRSIELGYSNDRHYEVLSGLSTGDELVTIGRASLKDGVLISVVDSER